MNIKSILILFVITILVAACSIRPPSIPGFPDDGDSAPSRRLDPNNIPDAVPQAERRSRSGNPNSYVVLGKRYHVMSSSDGFSQRGIASWYGTKFHGRTTSSGETYDMYAMTAAHKSLPLPTYVEVTNLDNGRRTIVKVNDRGPFHQNRIIDLSYAAATKLGILGKGTGLVEIRAIHPGQPVNRSAPVVTNEKPQSRGLFIQVGAFSSRHNADQLRRRLEETLNQAIRIQQSQQRGSSVYRVQVGPLASVNLADTLSQQLTRLGINETRIILD
ncbi:MAG: septal ring lytic transglycosylase RlpA family protein [Candidatus Sedimenticola sp. (ex Thyasira tokunagai)]